MKDNLEDFIRSNREAFDDKEPSARVWSAIDASVSVGRKTSLWNSVVIWRAAAIVLLGACIFLMVPKGDTQKQQTALTDFKDVESFYIQQISDKTDLIRDHFKMEGFNGFTNDFKQLEAMYQVLKEEMNARPSKQVKDALVLNLLVRIDLLNQQLQKLEEKKLPPDEDNESEEVVEDKDLANT
jgi:hypothetical protein